MACLHPVMMSPNLLTSNCILSFCGLMSPTCVWLQLQAQLQSSEKQPDLDNSLNHTQNGDDDIDAALNDLQVSLEGSSISSPGDITHIPELQDYLRFFK